MCLLSFYSLVFLLNTKRLDFIASLHHGAMELVLASRICATSRPGSKNHSCDLKCFSFSLSLLFLLLSLFPLSFSPYLADQLQRFLWRTPSWVWGHSKASWRKESRFLNNYVVYNIPSQTGWWHEQKVIVYLLSHWEGVVCCNYHQTYPD